MIKDAPRDEPGRQSMSIDALDDEGAGVGQLGGLRVHVPLALPGDTVECELEHRSPHRPEAWARLIAIQHPSPDRVAPRCPAFGRCGGCVLQHLDPARQLAWKRQFLVDELRALGSLEGPTQGNTVEVDPCVASPRLTGYRSHAKLVFAGVEAGAVVLGAYAPRSHEVVDLAGCAVVEPVLDETARHLAAIATRLGLPVYDEARASGVLRYALLRANADERVVVLLVVARRDPALEPRLIELARTLRLEVPAVAGVVENLQPARGNVLIGAAGADRVLDGEEAIEEVVGGAWLRLSPRAFFQPNREVAARLYADVATAAALRPDERALDLYCGVGGIAQHLAASGASVLGVDEVEDAVRDANAMAAVQNLTNVRFIAGDVALTLADAERVGSRADVVVVDPPRRGCDEAVLAGVARQGPRTVLYVSCSPHTLARDLARLDRLGYGVARVTPYDMLPHTPHVESLAVLVRR